MIVFTVSLRQGRGQLENLGFIHIGDLVFIRWDGNKMNRANESLLLRLN